MNERVGTVYTMAPEVLQGEYTKQVRANAGGEMRAHTRAHSWRLFRDRVVSAVDDTHTGTKTHAHARIS